MRCGGALRSENAGMSSEKCGLSPQPRKSKVSPAMSISRGLVGPKARLKSVVDGQTVNIPLPPVLTDGMTESDSRGGVLV